MSDSTNRHSQAWIYKSWVDSVFIIAPAFVATLLVIIFPNFFQENAEMPASVWLILIVGFDVAHVYSTLWRTYLDPSEFQRHRQLLTITPLAVWIVGVLLYILGPMVFWRVMAYLAVFHFIRQQYGFMALYARQEKRTIWERKIDELAIYAVTLFPILYWHTHLPRNFSWFVEGDFLPISFPWITEIGFGIYCILVLVYVAKEFLKFYRKRTFNIPKNLIFIGTGLSWFFGIVIRNGDLAFTATNVIAHGIPYMAIVWIYGRKKNPPKKDSEAPNIWMKIGFNAAFIPVFLGLLFVLGYVEEGLWDGMIWRDHESLFPWANSLPFLENPSALALIVPLLSIPQVTHYIVDGFIWKMRKPNADLKILENEGKI